MAENEHKLSTEGKLFLFLQTQPLRDSLSDQLYFPPHAIWQSLMMKSGWCQCFFCIFFFSPFFFFCFLIDVTDILQLSSFSQCSFETSSTCLGEMYATSSTFSTNKIGSKRHLKQTYIDKKSIIQSLTKHKNANCIVVNLSDEEQAKLKSSCITHI